ncbi:MAG: FkbM family methyltransferase [Rhodospirillales bacterium]|nr:FkbM family methyltransferase [Rhodospirillales bacterium]
MIPRFMDRLLSDASGPVGTWYGAYKAYRWGDPYIRLVASLADRARLAIDVGAHLGDYTFFMRRHAAGCVAFECNPALVAHLRRRFAGSIDLRADAVSSQAGTATLRIPREVDTGLGRATIESANPLDRDFSGFDLVTVRTVTLDEAVNRPVGLIKIDVEGHEMAVLHGAARILRDDKPNLIVELEDRHAPGCTAAAFEFLGQLGYRAACLQNGALAGIEPGRPLREGLWNFVFMHADRAPTF